MSPCVTAWGKISVRRKSFGLKNHPKIFLPRTCAPWCFPFAQPRNSRTAGDAVMTKSAQLLLLAVLGLAFFFPAPDSGKAHAQTTISGEWKASVGSEKSGDWGKWDDSDKSENADKADKADKLHLSFERRTEKGGHNNMGSN